MANYGFLTDSNIACYFNSLIQSYFYIPEFTNKILETQVFIEQNSVRSSNIVREKACHVLGYQLQGLFSKFAMTNKRYTEPSDVLRALVDDYG